MSDRTIKNRLEKVETKLGEIETTLLEIKVRGETYDAKLDAYQKASAQVVNLAFALIVTAVLAIIVPAVLGR